jgi:uncharacterized membrane protein YraQ (UPF0718 family)
VPSDIQSVLLLILLEAGATVARLWPYVAGGVLLALLLSRLAAHGHWSTTPARFPRPLMLPVAALAGTVSPLPTLGTVPLLLRFRAQGTPSRPVLAFVVASSLMNPQLFVLTLGALGPLFALVHVGAVLLLGVALALILGGSRLSTETEVGYREASPARVPRMQAGHVVGHVAFYFLLGVTAGAGLHVLLPYLGIIGWLDARGWLSSPLLGWIAAPFYVCGGSAVPLAASMMDSGFSAGTMFAFLLVGPALRGTTLASLGCLLPKRSLVLCLALLAVAGGLLGVAFDLVVKLV